MKTSFCAVLLSLLFVSAQARCEEVKSYKTDLEYVFALLDSTSLNVDIHKSLYGLDAEKIKAAFRAQVDTVHSQEAFYRLVQQLLGCYHDPLARTLYPGNAYWLKGSKEAFQTFSYIFEINMISRYYRWNRGFRGKWEGDAFYLREMGQVEVPGRDATRIIRLEDKPRLLSVDGIPVANLKHHFDAFSTDEVGYKAGEAYPKSLLPKVNVLLGIENGDSISIPCPYAFDVAYEETEIFGPNQGLPYSVTSDSSGKTSIRIYLCNLKQKNWSECERLIARLKRSPIETEIIIDARLFEASMYVAPTSVLWEKLLSLLIDTDLECSMDLAVKKSSFTYGFLNTPNKQGLLTRLYAVRETNIPELDNLPVYTFTKNIRLEKNRKSLNHSGKISILFDDGVSFASLSLRRFAACFPDKFTVLEDDLDYVGDLALPPFEYVLPYSQIMICIPACAGVDAISKILAK